MEYITFRTLEISELSEWSQLCADAFAEKPRPPTANYFLSHFHNDPDADISGIFVAVDKSTNQMVATVRLFWRRQYLLVGTNFVIHLCRIVNLQSIKVCKRTALEKYVH